MNHSSLSVLVAAGVCTVQLCLLSLVSIVVAGEVIQDEFAVEEIAPGLYVHEGKHEQLASEFGADIANSGFIVGSSAVAVIDPGGSLAVGQQLRSAIESVTDLPVRYLFLTHFHPDHVFGASAFSDVPHIIAHGNYPRAMAQRLVFYQQRFTDLLEGVEEITLPTMLIDGTQSIDLGNRILQVQSHPPAHTDNDLSIIDTMTDTLWASDLVFSQRTPALDGSLGGWLTVLANLGQQQYELVIPGHGKPGSWNDTVAPQLAYLQDIKRAVREQIDRGKSLAEVVNQAPADNRTGWILYKDQHPTNLTKAYTELEWE